MLIYSMYARDWNSVLSVTVYIHGISIFWSLRVFSIICSVFRCSLPSITEQLAEPLLDSDHSFFMLSDTLRRFFRSSSVWFFFVIYLLLPLDVFVRSNSFFLSIIQSFSWIRYHRLCVTPGCHSFSTSSAGSYLSPAASWETLSVECDVLSALLIIGSAHQPALSCTKPQAETLILSKICRKHFHVSQNTVLIIGCR